MGIIRSLDCYADVGLTFRLWGNMLTFKGIGNILTGGIMELGLGVADWMIVLIGIAIMYAVSKMSAKGSVRERLYSRPVLSAVLCGVMFIAVIMLGVYGFGYDASGFIYGTNY
jgi:hypothetical protein